MGNHNNKKSQCNDGDIEELHHQAVLQGLTTYKDPATGFTVFTEISHLKRGKCCGNVCRHCPYGWENVNTQSRNAKLASGDTEKAKRLLQKIQYESSSTTVPDITTKSTSTTVTKSESARPIGESRLLSQEPASNHESSSSSNSTSNNQTALPPPTTKTATIVGKGGRHGGRHTTKNVPYTRGGDKGTSQLLTGERRSKADDAFEAMGTVDELCSIVGVVHAELMATTATSTAKKGNKGNNGDTNCIDYGELPEWLLDVMSRLFDIGSHVAKPQKIVMDDYDDEDDSDADNTTTTFTADGVGGGFHEAHIEIIEDWIDVMTEKLPELSSFVLPTGAKGAAHLHVARTVCRRAERRIVPLVQDGVCDPNAMKYVNRLSDFFFTAARYVNYCENHEEVQYRRDYRGAKQRQRCAVPLQQQQQQQEK